MQKEKPTVRYRSKLVEKDREIKKRYFRHFIYWGSGIAGEVCKNLPFTCKNPQKP